MIKPTEGIFSFIEWGNSSIYYGFDEVSKDKMIVKEVHPKELESLSVKRVGEIFDLCRIEWFPIDELDNALEIYLK